MTTQESIPPEITALLNKYSAKTIKKPETTTLLKWIIEMMKVAGFELKTLLTDEYGYDDKEYKRLQKAINRFKKTLEQTATQKLAELQAGDFSRYIEDMWEDAKNIGTTAVMTWRSRAIEYGYYNEETDTVRMRDFIMDACNFYTQNRERIYLLEEENKDISAAAQVFAEMAKPNMLRITALRIYTQFCSHAMTLAIAGIPVPDSIIQDVRLTVDKAILSSTIPQERLNAIGK